VGPIIIYSRGNAQKEKEREKRMGRFRFYFGLYLSFATRPERFRLHSSLSLASSFLFFSVCGGDVRGDFFIFSVVVVVDRSAARMVVAS
jgi:hypothetical protein